MSNRKDESANRRPPSVILGILFSLLVRAMALVAAKVGFAGKGSAAAWPNLLTGVALFIGTVGYFMLKKWAVPVYRVAVVGHFVSHTTLLSLRSGSGHVTLPMIVVLAIVPLIALAILVNMERQRRQGLLS